MGRAGLAGEAAQVNLIRNLSSGLAQLGAIAFAEELVFRLALFRLASMVAPRVRREALRRIPDSVGRNLEECSWVNGLPGRESARGQ